MINLLFVSVPLRLKSPQKITNSFCNNNQVHDIAFKT